MSVVYHFAFRPESKLDAALVLECHRAKVAVVTYSTLNSTDLRAFYGVCKEAKDFVSTPWLASITTDPIGGNNEIATFATLGQGMQAREALCMLAGVSLDKAAHRAGKMK